MIYLDNAATSFPKPRRVIEEQLRCMRAYCGNPGRGSHALSRAAAEKIYECRTEAAELFGLENPESVMFTMNATMAINTVIKGVLQMGDHVLLSDMEHNAVYRPIYKMARAGLISYDIFPTYANDPSRTASDICAAIEGLIKPRTRMLICAHASNICSASLPIAEIGALCRRHGIFFALDAAQSAGHMPINMERMQIDALCAPGHKGLLGPQGSGLLLLSEAAILDTLMEGGSGVNSLEGSMPDESPERYEAGTLPTPAIAGLCEGIRAVKRIGVENVHEYTCALTASLRERLLQMERVRVYAPHHEGAVLLFHIDGISADRLGEMLDRQGICVRAGYHCSALAHATLQTPNGGAVRISTGFFNTPAEIQRVADVISTICNNA